MFEKKEYFHEIRSIRTYRTFYNCLNFVLTNLREQIPYDKLKNGLKNDLPKIYSELLLIEKPEDRKYYSEDKEEEIYRCIYNIMFPYLETIKDSQQFKKFVDELTVDEFLNNNYLIPLKSTDGKVLQWSKKYKKDTFSDLLNNYITLYIYFSLDFKFDFEWKYVLNTYQLMENYVCKYGNSIIYRAPLGGFSMEANYLRLSDGVVIRKMYEWEKLPSNAFDSPRVDGKFMIEFSCPINSSDASEFCISPEQEKLDRIITILLLFKEGKFRHTGMHCLLTSFQMGFRMYNGGAFYRFSIPPHYADYTLSKSDLKSFKDFFYYYNVIFNPKNRTDKKLLTVITIAVRRLRSSINELDQTDKIIDLMIAAEGLLGDDTQELSHKLALRLSFLVSKDFGERKKIFGFVKKMYTMRSKAVHGEDISNKKISHDNRELTLAEASSLLESFIRSSILIYLDLAILYKKKEAIINLIDHLIFGYLNEDTHKERIFSRHLGDILFETRSQSNTKISSS
jgi:hypothetical protein